MGLISFSQFIEESENIAIAVSEVKGFDKACSIIALANLIESFDKQAFIITSKKPQEDISKLFQKHKVPVKTKLQIKSYVVSIDYTKTPIEKVSYDVDEENGRINFFIFPKGRNFDFNDIEYDQGGGDFDHIIAYDISGFDELGDVYQNNKKSFKIEETFAIGKNFTFQGVPKGEVNFIEVNFPKTYTKSLLDIIRREFPSFNYDKDAAQLLLDGMVSNSGYIEAGKTLDESLEFINYLAKSGASLAKSFKKNYYNRSVDDVLVESLMLDNFEVDYQSGVAWSKVSQSEIAEIVENSGDYSFQLKGRLPFNKVEKIKIAIGVVEQVNGDIWVRLESNDPEKYSAQEIAEVFDGEGTEEFAEFIMPEIKIADFEKVLFPVISQFWGISVKA